MGIRFIYGRAGSGKSTFCLNEIKKKVTDWIWLYLSMVFQFPLLSLKILSLKV